MDKPTIPDDLQEKYKGRTFPVAFDDLVSDLAKRLAAAEAREKELWAEIERLKQTKEKIAPVQGYSAGIPWSMHLRAYDAYCKRFGSQKALIDLEGRNCRGGFGVNELDEFIPGWRSELREIVSLRTRAEKAETDTQWMYEDYDRLVDNLKGALGEELLQTVCDPVIGFVEEDLVRGIQALRAQLAEVTKQVSDEEEKLWAQELTQDGGWAFSRGSVHNLLAARAAKGGE